MSLNAPNFNNRSNARNALIAIRMMHMAQGIFFLSFTSHLVSNIGRTLDIKFTAEVFDQIRIID